jgi:hypothetical protein
MRAPRPCSYPGCPTIVTSGACSVHARPGPRARGYDTSHDQRRAADLRALAANPGRPCPWCGTPMHPGMALDWDHTKQGLACARCNRADGGRRSHSVTEGGG